MSIPDPVVLLDARARYVHPAFQMTRASTKTVWDSAGRLVTVPANAIGWDHDPATGQARGYLSEPQATNLLLHSNDLTQSPWALQRASIAAGTVGPDGQSMAKLVESTETGAHYLRQTVNIQAGEAHCYSAIVKAAERTSIYFWARTQEENSIEAIFHLSDGTYNTSTRGEGVVFGAGAIDIGGGFFRVWISGTLGLGDDTAQLFTILRHSSGGNEYEGDGTSGIYLGYYQAEVGSYPTSYIETGASTVTRAGDSLVLSGLGNFPWWRSERGAILVEADAPPLPWNIASQGQFWMFSGSSQFRLSAFPSGACQIRGGNFSTVTVSGNVSGVYNKIAVAWDVGDEVAVSRNGGSVNTAAWSGNLDISGFAIGVNPGNSIQQLTFPVSRVIYYPQRPSNADLQSLTAIQE